MSSSLVNEMTEALTSLGIGTKILPNTFNLPGNGSIHERQISQCTAMRSLGATHVIGGTHQLVGQRSYRVRLGTVALNKQGDASLEQLTDAISFQINESRIPQ